jgi:phage baseplate assembly protein W
MLAFPLQVSPIGGLVESIDPMGDRIRFFLDTRYWERVMFPDFGIPNLVFDPVAATDISLIVAALTVALQYWISPEITVRSLGLPVEDGTIQLLIEYGDGGLIEFSTDQYLLNRTNAT